MLTQKTNIHLKSRASTVQNLKCTVHFYILNFSNYIMDYI